MKVNLSVQVWKLFEPQQSRHLLIGPELTFLMNIDMILMQVLVVRVSVSQEQSNTWNIDQSEISI